MNINRIFNLDGYPRTEKSHRCWPVELHLDGYKIPHRELILGVLTVSVVGSKLFYMADEVTNKDILEAIGVFSNVVEKRFDSVDQRLERVETKLDRALYTELVALESRVKRLEQKVGLAAS